MHSVHSFSYLVALLATHSVEIEVRQHEMH